MSDSIENVKTKSKTFIILLFAFFLFIVAAAIGFSWYQAHWRYQSLSLQQTSDETELKQVKQTLSQLTENNAQLQRAQTSQDELLNNQAQRLAQLNQRLDQDKETRQLMRIEYLIQMAHYQSAFMHNRQNAMALLEAAQQDIKDNNAASASGLAAAISKDIEALKALPALNLDETLSQLNTLDQALNQLPLILPQFNAFKENAVSAAPAVSMTHTANNPREWQWWQTRLSALWAELRKLIVIRHNNTVITPILDTEQQTYLRDNLHLILFQAKWALLNQDNALYHSSLSQLVQWINTYFNINNPDAKTVLANLESLQSIQLTNTFPRFEASLSALAAIKSADNMPSPSIQNQPEDMLQKAAPPAEPAENKSTLEATDS